MRTKDAIEHFGTAAALAAKLQINQSAISQWGEFPPYPRQFQIQVATGGKLKAEKAA